jgi:sugar lactone lactonase YvrE
MIRSKAAWAGAFLVGVLGWLMLAPTPVEPVAWNPPGAPPATGAYAPNQALAAAQRFAQDLPGPEAAAVGPRGEIYTGLVDGRVMVIEPDGKQRKLANTGGRPIGLKRAANGNLLVCDALKGLLSIAPDGTVSTLASGHAGKAFVFADDLDVAQDGTIYFSDASARFGVFEFSNDVLEHGSTGRLLAFDPATRETRVLMEGLSFSNGVALNSDQSFLAINETATYRIHRYWLTGPRAGTHDILIDNLPGFPDNVTWSPAHQVFWVALFAPRNPLLDLTLPFPLLRKLTSRLPAFLQPKAEHHGWVLGVSEDGTVKYSFEDPAGGYAPVTSAVEHDGTLVLGSLTANGLARFKLP